MFYAGLRQLEAYGSSEVRFTVHEDMAHDTWTRVYASDDFYTWLLAHSLNSNQIQPHTTGLNRPIP